MKKNLVWLDLGAQVVNTFMLPVLIAVLLVFVQTAVPEADRLRGSHLWVLLALSVLVCCGGLFGGLGSWAQH